MVPPGDAPDGGRTLTLTLALTLALALTLTPTLALALTLALTTALALIVNPNPNQACAALRAAQAIWRAHGEGGEGGEGGAGGGASPIEGVTVVGQPLAGVLQGLLQAGSLMPAECEGLL